MTSPPVRFVDQYELRQVFGVLRKHLGVIVLLAVVGGGAGALWSMYGPVGYESQVTMIVPKPVLVMPPDYTVPSVDGIVPDRMSIEGICLAPDIVRGVVARLNDEAGDDVSPPRPDLSPADFVSMASVKVNGSEMFSLKVRAPEPVLAQRLVQIWSELAIGRMEQLYRVEAAQVRRLASRLAAARQERAQATAALQALREDGSAAARQAQLAEAQAYLDQLAAGRERLALLRGQAQALQATMEPTPGGEQASATVRPDQWLTLRRIEEWLAQANLAGDQPGTLVQASTGSSEAPATAAAARQRLTAVLEATDGAAAAMEAQQTALSQRLAGHFADARTFEQERARLEETQRLATERVERLSQQQTVLEMLLIDQGDLVRVASPAMLPTVPATPPPTVLIGLSALVGGLVGVGVAMVRGQPESAA